jgi:membrane-associated phospholipid phosphatase
MACAYVGPRLRWPAISVAITIAVLVGISRVYLGVHWLTDVLGASTMSIALLALVGLVWLLVAERDEGSPEAFERV